MSGWVWYDMFCRNINMYTCMWRNPTFQKFCFKRCQSTAEFSIKIPKLQWNWNKLCLSRSSRLNTSSTVGYEINWNCDGEIWNGSEMKGSETLQTWVQVETVQSRRRIFPAPLLKLKLRTVSQARVLVTTSASSPAVTAANGATHPAE